MGHAGGHGRIDIDHNKFWKDKRRSEEGLRRLKKLLVVQDRFGALDEGLAAPRPVSPEPGLRELFGFGLGGVVDGVGNCGCDRAIGSMSPKHRADRLAILERRLDPNRLVDGNSWVSPEVSLAGSRP